MFTPDRIWVVAYCGEPIWKTTSPSRNQSILAFVWNSGLELSKGEALRYFEQECVTDFDYSCEELAVTRVQPATA